MLFVDTDNALGSIWGRVDDGLALAALIKSGVPISAIASVFGNTREWQVYRNNQCLSDMLGYRGPLLRGMQGPRDSVSAASRFLTTTKSPVQVIALGPLTNIASALKADPSVNEKIKNIVLVGSDTISNGRWPPLWPQEFNITKDLKSAHRVFNSGISLVVLPMNVGRRLEVTLNELQEIPKPLGSFVLRNTRWKRWRSAVYRFSTSLLLWDVVAAFYVIDPTLFRTEIRKARIHANGWVQYGSGGTTVTTIEDYEPKKLWDRFVEILHQPANAASLPKVVPSS